MTLLGLKPDSRSQLAVHERSEQLAVPILHVPRLVPSSLEQRLEPLLRFRPRQRGRERREGVKEALGGWQRDVVNEFFRCCDGAPVEAGNSARECIHEAVQLLVRKRPIDVSVSLSGLAVEVGRTEHDFERAASADERWKALGAAAAGMHARANFHLRQRRVLSRGESHVAGEEELARYSTGPAPDLRDADNPRLGETNERIQQRREAGGPDSFKQGEGSRRVFHLKVGEIEVGICALEYDDTKARASVHSRE